MANNPYVNKVEYAGQTIMDISGDSVTPSDVLNGVSFHDRSGAPQTGNLIVHDVYDGLDSTSTSDALSAKQGKILNDNKIDKDTDIEINKTGGKVKVYVDNEGGNIRLEKGNCHAEIDIALMNTSNNGAARIYLNDGTGTEFTKGFAFNQDGSFTDGNGVNTANLTAGPSSSTNNHVAVFDGTTGKTIKDSGYTIGKSVPSDAKFTDTTYSDATTSASGLMSATDKTKLNGIATGATANTGTITGITMNGSSKGTSGVVNLGTVLTAHRTYKIGSVTKSSGTASTGSSFGSITANVGSGETFLCWLAPSTSGFVAAVYMEDVASKTTNIWASYCPGSITLGGSLGIVCKYIYY